MSTENVETSFFVVYLFIHIAMPAMLCLARKQTENTKQRQDMTWT